MAVHLTRSMAASSERQRPAAPDLEHRMNM